MAGEITMNRLNKIITTAALAATTAAMAANAGGPLVESHVQGFLDALAKGSGQPIETLSPADARQVLIGAQQGAKLPPAK
jgi:hypothetical protein